MALAHQVLAVNENLPIRTATPVHSGKVRSVYWLDEHQSCRLIEERGYPVAGDAQLGVMVISDRLSAFDCIWRAEGGLEGVPGKGAALNAIAGHWFEGFRQHGLADSHILECPHPLVWIVQRARPIKVEAIARRHITGSLWRAYQDGTRDFCGHRLEEGLKAHQRLPQLLLTPSTKGLIRGLPDVPEAEDVNVSQELLQRHYSAFGYARVEDVATCNRLLTAGFELIEDALASLGQIFVDTKFEFGYAADAQGRERLIYIDEVGTPDSSRIWDADAYQAGEIVEHSKEGFRQALLAHFRDPRILLDASRLDERQALARETRLPEDFFQAVAETYREEARRITGRAPEPEDRPREALLDILNDRFGLVR